MNVPHTLFKNLPNDKNFGRYPKVCALKMNVGKLDIYGMTYSYNRCTVHQVASECVEGIKLYTQHFT
jgi:hypothetical protein